MPSTTLTIRLAVKLKKRLDRLAKNTGRSQSVLATEALNEYLDVKEWQFAGITRAIGSLDRGDGVPHPEVRALIAKGMPKSSKPKA
jgi:RHH-type transcriptional regulator, rel operon repressor / antitoxin RelB